MPCFQAALFQMVITVAGGLPAICYSQMNLRNTLLGLHIPIFLQGGLGTGSTVEVNSDTLRVRTKPEVRMEGPGGLYMTLGVV